MNLLVLDDRILFNSYYNEQLGASFEHVRVIHSPNAVGSALDAAQCDVILVHSRIPGCDLYALINAVRQSRRPPRIVVLLEHADSAAWTHFRALGASGIANTHGSLEELVATLRGGINPEAGVTSVIPSPPTGRKLDVLHYLARGLERKQIAARLRQSLQRIDVLISELKECAGATTCAHLILLAIHYGWINPWSEVHLPAELHSRPEDYGSGRLI